jgi:HEAT repeat protein
MTMLFFCPQCRRPFEAIQICPACNLTTDTAADTYVEKLLEAVLSKETSRAGMAVDVLTKWLHEPRAFLLLTMLLERTGDPYPLVIGARGLGWLGNKAAVPALAKLLLNESQPYVARVAAAEALSRIGGEESIEVLSRARQSPRSSVAEACDQALQKLLFAEQEIQS